MVYLIKVISIIPVVIPTSLKLTLVTDKKSYIGMVRDEKNPDLAMGHEIPIAKFL